MQKYIVSMYAVTQELDVKITHWLPIAIRDQSGFITLITDVQKSRPWDQANTWLLVNRD